jgi:hypothetical protein
MNDELIIYHINDCVLNNCPHVDVFFGKEMMNVIIDSGVEISSISERAYNKLIMTDMCRRYGIRPEQHYIGKCIRREN